VLASAGSTSRKQLGADHPLLDRLDRDAQEFGQVLGPPLLDIVEFPEPVSTLLPSLVCAVGGEELAEPRIGLQDGVHLVRRRASAEPKQPLHPGLGESLLPRLVQHHVGRKISHEGATSM
jgi:hypothetical protein